MSLYDNFMEQINSILLYKQSLLEGFWLTTKLGVLSLLVALILGIAVALCATSQSRILKVGAFLYTTFIRGVPDIVLIFLFYYGIQEGVNKITSALGMELINLNQFIVGVIVIGLIFGAFMAETFRGALLSVPKGQKEAAQALGLTAPKLYRRIIFPQAMRYALPGLSNNWLVLLKATALVSLINLQDFVFIAKSAGSATREPFTFNLFAAIGFLFFTTVSIIVIKWLEKHFSKGVVQSEAYYG